MRKEWQEGYLSISYKHLFPPTTIADAKIKFFNHLVHQLPFQLGSSDPYGTSVPLKGAMILVVNSPANIN